MKGVRKNIGAKISLILLLLSGLGYGALFTYFDHTNQFPIKNIKIIGTYDYVNTEDIQKTLTPFVLGKGLFAFDEMKAEKALEQLPGVQDVSIWRLPLDKVRVILREKRAVARLVNGKLLASDGTYFDVNPPKAGASLPIIAGDLHYLKQILAMMQSLQVVFSYDGLTVSGVGLAQNGDWSVQINNEAWVVLGKYNLPERVANFLILYPVLMKNAPPGELPLKIDLRYLHGVAVSWQDVPQ